MFDIMLDLETLGTRQSSIVTSIGAVKFNVKTFEIVSHYKENPMAVEQERLGRTMDARTILWWLQQDDDAVRRMTENPVPVDAALMSFIEFVGDDTRAIWGNGSDFDNVILGSLYESAGIRKPWSYSQNRCFRTFKREFPIQPPVREGIHHDALDDAVYQVKWLQQIYKTIKEPNANV